MAHAGYTRFKRLEILFKSIHNSLPYRFVDDKSVVGVRNIAVSLFPCEVQRGCAVSPSCASDTWVRRMRTCAFGARLVRVSCAILWLRASSRLHFAQPLPYLRPSLAVIGIYKST